MKTTYQRKQNNKKEKRNRKEELLEQKNQFNSIQLFYFEKAALCLIFLV